MANKEHDNRPILGAAPRRKMVYTKGAPRPPNDEERASAGEGIRLYGAGQGRAGAGCLQRSVSG